MQRLTKPSFLGLRRSSYSVGHFRRISTSIQALAPLNAGEDEFVGSTKPNRTTGRKKEPAPPQRIGAKSNSRRDLDGPPNIKSISAAPLASVDSSEERHNPKSLRDIESLSDATIAQSLYDMADAPVFRRRKGLPRPDKDESRPRTQNRKKVTPAELSPLADGEEEGSWKEKGNVMNSDDHGSHIDDSNSDYRSTYGVPESLDAALDEYFEIEKNKNEVVDPEYFDSHILPELASLPDVPVEELERRLLQKDGRMRGMYTLDELEKLSETDIVNMFGVWGSVDPIPDEILDRHVNEEDFYEDDDSDGDSDDYDDSASDDGSHGRDSEYEDAEASGGALVQAPAAKPVNAPDTSFVIPLDETAFEYGEPDLPLLPVASLVKEISRDVVNHEDDELAAYIANPFAHLDADFASAATKRDQSRNEDISVRRENANPVVGRAPKTSHTYASSDSEGESGEEGEEEGDPDIAMADAALDPARNRSTRIPEDAAGENNSPNSSKYSKRLDRRQKDKTVKERAWGEGLGELDPYKQEKHEEGEDKLGRLLAAAKRRDIVSRTGQPLKELRPREGADPKRRQMTVGALIERCLDKIFSSDRITYKGEKNLLDVIDITSVEMTGDLQIAKVIWRLSSGGGAYRLPPEHNSFHEERSQDFRLKAKRTRSSRREESRQWKASLANKAELDVKAWLESMGRLIRHELSRHLSMKRVPKVIFEMDVDSRRDVYVRSEFERLIERGSLDRACLPPETEAMRLDRELAMEPAANARRV